MNLLPDFTLPSENRTALLKVMTDRGVSISTAREQVDLMVHAVTSAIRAFEDTADRSSDLSMALNIKINALPWLSMYARVMFKVAKDLGLTMIETEEAEALRRKFTAED